MKLTKACSYLKNPNCLFFATNEDACLPINSETITIPGNYYMADEGLYWTFSCAYSQLSFSQTCTHTHTHTYMHARTHTHKHTCMHARTHTTYIHTHKHTGTGCIVNSVKHGSGREPTVVGKPHNPIFEVIQHNTKLDPTKTLMIGDRWAVVCITYYSTCSACISIISAEIVKCCYVTSIDE